MWGLFFWRRTEQVEDGLLDKPRLRHSGDDVLDDELEENFPDDISFNVGRIVLGRQTYFEDKVESVSEVLLVYVTFRGDGQVRLKQMEELRYGVSSASRIGSGHLGSSMSVVYEMLGDEGWDVAEDQGGQVCTEYALFECPDDMDEHLGELGEKLLIVAGDLGPPGVDICAQ